VGFLILLSIMLTYPTATETGRQRLRFWLDSGAVLVGAAGLAWSMALLLIDLDDLRSSMTRWAGHPAGDAVLSAVAERLRACVRDGDTPARLGGDEFALLLPGASVADAQRVADRLREALAVPVDAGGALVQVRASVGIAGTRGESGDALLRRADSAMYGAKQRDKRRRRSGAPA
jgi:diguanylate cyclase (GGDEF)-like protein